MALELHPEALKKTFALIAKGKQLKSTGGGPEELEARCEFAVFLEHWAKLPTHSILRKDGTIDTTMYEEMLGEYQSNHDLKVDKIIGVKTVASLNRNLGNFAANNRDKLDPNKSRAVSCEPAGLGNFKGQDCPQLEKFMAEIAEKPILESKDISRLAALSATLEPLPRHLNVMALLKKIGFDRS